MELLPAGGPSNLHLSLGPTSLAHAGAHLMAPMPEATATEGNVVVITSLLKLSGASSSGSVPRECSPTPWEISSVCRSHPAFKTTFNYVQRETPCVTRWPGLFGALLSYISL